ncbi:MAG: aldehyde dehydrogenase family protein, partial [Sphingobium sp.]
MTDTAYGKPFLYIDGEFIEGGDRQHQDIINPANGEVIGSLPHARRDDLDRALNAAQRAFESWRKSSPLERSKVLRRVAELTRERAPQVARQITLDQGKPLSEALLEVTTCAE